MCRFTKGYPVLFEEMKERTVKKQEIKAWKTNPGTDTRDHNALICLNSSKRDSPEQVQSPGH